MKVRVFVACDELSPRIDADRVVVEIGGPGGERFVSRFMSSKDAVDLCRRTKDTFEKLTTRIAELEGALQPFAYFAEQYDRQPLRGVADTLYGIHTGTEFEAELTLTACRAARDVLKKP